MSVAVTTENKTLYTPEDLLAMPDGKNYELVDGRLIKRNVGAESSWIGGRIYFRLSLFCDQHQLGYVWPADNGYQCFAHAPKLVRRPDTSFIRIGRLSGGELPKGHVRIPPTWPSKLFLPTTWPLTLTRRSKTTRKQGLSWSG